MQQHRFRIGQSIEFKYSLRTRSAAPGRYRIVGYQPSEDGEARYRIKSDLEQYERIAREDELNRIS
jgi:hypothetical protein